jgi:hypothetical protein
MKYLLLIYGEDGNWEAKSDEERQAMYAEYGTLVGDLTQRGKMVGGDELQPASTATTVRVRNGETMVTDGPFAETKEALGGYFVVEAESLDEALEIAARIPTAREGSIEVRPVVERE